MAPPPRDLPAGRFAPSPSGPAHLGTLLAGLLAWLDARQHDLAFWLRLEDLDRQRCRPEHAAALVAALRWLGLDWDGQTQQSSHAAGHAAALDALARQGRLYACTCSRRRLQQLGRRGPDGGWAYDNACRAHCVSPEAWRHCSAALRARLPDGGWWVPEEGAASWQQDPAAALGDPVVRRRDGAVAYQLAVVVDDAAAQVRRVVRGRDLVVSTPTQRALQQLLGLPSPVWRHHFLLCDAAGRKLGKSCGAVAAATAGPPAAARRLCGQLATWAGLMPRPLPCTPTDLLGDFCWERVRRADLRLAAAALAC